MTDDDDDDEVDQSKRRSKSVRHSNAKYKVRIVEIYFMASTSMSTSIICLLLHVMQVRVLG